LIFRQVKSEGIAHTSYLISSQHIGAVIDPRRDCDIYLDIAREEDLSIRYIFETHRNEDYATGSLELAHRTQARIYHGPGIDFAFGETLRDGQVFELGELRLEAIHTPGHTDESMSYALFHIPSGENPFIVFTGDALFVGDVGRTDLYGPAEAHRLAESLYTSIFEKVLPLGDGVILCPAHGAGSICGASISGREKSTLGLERKLNPMLQLDRESFIARKAGEELVSPPYFKMMERYNLKGPPLLGHLPDPPPLKPEKFQELRSEGAQVIDTRNPPSFGAAHIPGSLSMPLGRLPLIAGWALSYEKPLLLVLSRVYDLERVTRFLIRLGYDDIAGYLCSGSEGCGLEAWYTEAHPLSSIGLLSVMELKERLDAGEEITALDVRPSSQWANGHIPPSLNVFWGDLSRGVGQVPRGPPAACVCTSGNFASFAASILRRDGFKEVYTVLGSMMAWARAGYPVVVEENT